jgi:hypothetical protein
VNRPQILDAIVARLTVVEKYVILVAPYDEPAHLTGPRLRAARRLEKLHLVEHDPSAPRIFRCTDIGEQVRKHMLRKSA